MRLSFVTEPVNSILLAIVIFLVITIITTFTKTNKIIEYSKFIFIFVLGIIFRIAATLFQTGNDVYWVSKGSIDAILNGINPYSTTFDIFFNPTPTAAVNAYFPFTILFETPFQFFLGDLRYGIIFADVGIALFIYLIVRTKNEDLGRAASSFYLLVTSLTFVFANIIFDYRISDGLTDPIMTFFLLGSVYACMKDKRLVVALLIGLAMATRQFSILFFLPMLLLWIQKDEFGHRQLKLIIISLLIPIIIIAPFFLWSPQDFISDTILHANTVELNPSLGGPQWNMAIFPQLKFLGVDAGLNLAKITQLISMILILVFFRKKIINIETHLPVFVILYVIFLATSNLTQYFYWFNLIPFLLIIFSFHFIRQKKDS